ncbi:hypothetical protein ACYCH7_28250, partial [Klebsiella pneumoniae]
RTAVNDFMDSVHHIWCPLSSQEFQDLPDGAETTLTDILAGVPALHDAAAQLIIVTSQGYRGPLQPFLKRSRADMMATLKSNMTCLNIACAGALIDAMMQADARQAATI